MSFDQVLRKNFGLVILPLIAVAAFLNAQAITQLVGIGLMPDEKAFTGNPAAAKITNTSTTPTRNLSASPILERNPFDHVTGSLKPPVVDDSVAGRSLDTTTPWTAPACDGVKVLIVAKSEDYDWSFAALSGSDNKTVLRRRGGDFNGKKVYYVGWDRVWFDNNGALCQAQVFAPPAGSGGSTPSTPAPATNGPTGSPKGLAGELAKGIQKTGPTTWDIDRATVDKILENQAELMRTARVVPESENGRVVGIKLMNIKSDSILGLIGMQTGDRLQTINGFEMASPEKALEAYARLRTAEKLQISINRAGQNVNLDYTIK